MLDGSYGPHERVHLSRSCMIYMAIIYSSLVFLQVECATYVELISYLLMINMLKNLYTHGCVTESTNDG